MRACTKCGETKPLDQFPPVRRGEAKLQSWCRECFAEANGRNYRKNREREKARLYRNAAVRLEFNRAQIVGYLRQHPCVDCGESDIVVLQFDHLRDKKYDVARMLNGGFIWPTIQREIDKCEVRCANCHRLKTAFRYLERSHRSATRIRQRIEQLRLADIGVRACRVCKLAKPMTDFPYRSQSRGTRQWICLLCQREVSRAWYLRRAPEATRVSGYRERRRQSLMARVDEYLLAHPCIDCGESNPVLLDFDHFRDKVADVATMVCNGRPWDEIEAEIGKCEVRCANCHARRTAAQRNTYKLACV
jgi:hypothetical protein